ncbi:hypothetical protein DRE_03236 [Drechslerella stenobrocha 248]|uniref:Ubiquitin-like domain-containing protein n=1 Tax=Drechslerella stenobrocha 248 TaxID=1043628 RepID=W7HTX9_9PEZI|nr:hypothetical protein DRE_03236 [Drechslerella stenobrocha 248]
MSSSSSARDPAREPLLSLHGSFSASSSSAVPSGAAARLPPPTPVSITVRFASSSLPDHTLTIETPYSTNISTIKRLIRVALPAETGRRRLRLIYGGKVLGDAANIGQALGVSKLSTFGDEASRGRKAPPPPPKRASRKGKEVVRPEPVAGIGSRYTSTSQAIHQPSTLPAPQGFDRLLNAGFTEVDIAALRSQFHGTLLSNTAPSLDGGSDAPNGLGFSLLDEESRRRALALEERWIDESATNETETADTGANNESGGLEDTLIGVMWGFFWPLCIMWMLREEGTLGNSKRQLAVIAGLLMNCVFGLLRLGSAS